MNFSARLKYCDCPICGMQLIDLSVGDPFAEEGEHLFWCQKCNVEIIVTELPHEDKVED